MYDVIIVGSGPAGISAALYAARAGLKTLVISTGIGSLGKAEKIQNYYGFAQPIPAKELAEAGIEGAKNVGVEFVETEVVGINFIDSLVIETKSKKYLSNHIILATGSSHATPLIKGIKDFEGKGISYCAICDGFFYKGKDIAVLGNGDFALHEIEALLPVVKSVTLLTNGSALTTTMSDAVAINKNKISKITGQEHLEAIEFADGSNMHTDGIFIAYGVAGSTDLARKIGAIIEGNKIVVDENMATNIPGLYAAGDCTGGDRKSVV